MLHGQGVNQSGLMHHADWLPTLLEAAGVAYEPAPGFELHGASQWAMLTAGAPSSRNEPITTIDPLQPAVGGGAIQPGEGNAAIITAEGWKLLLGLVGPPDAWSPPNASAASAALGGGGGAAAPPPPAAHLRAAAAVNCAAAFEVGVCFPKGADIRAANPTAAGTAAACCAHCAATAGCGAWTWRATEQQCWVKGDVAQRANNSDCVSGAGAPSPPTPFAVWPLKNMTAQ